MTLLAHPSRAGSSHFFTLHLDDPDSEMLTTHVDLLRAAVRQTRTEQPFEIDAWVTLPNHLHAVWRLPPGTDDAHSRWDVIKARFVQLLPGGPRQRRQPLWRESLWSHHIRGPQEHRHLIRYCWMNPVKHGLARHPGDWAYTSFHRDRCERIAQDCGVSAHPVAPAEQGLQGLVDA